MDPLDVEPLLASFFDEFHSIPSAPPSSSRPPSSSSSSSSDDMMSAYLSSPSSYSPFSSPSPPSPPPPSPDVAEGVELVESIPPFVSWGSPADHVALMGHILLRQHFLTRVEPWLGENEEEEEEEGRGERGDEEWKGRGLAASVVEEGADGGKGVRIHAEDWFLWPMTTDRFESSEGWRRFVCRENSVVVVCSDVEPVGLSTAERRREARLPVMGWELTEW